jgi:hypothetical protein
VVGLIAVAALVVSLTRDHGGSNDSGGEFISALPPDEFLYLDGGKILTYLSELEGGERGPVHRIAKEVKELKGTIGTDGFNVGAMSQRETSAESTLVRTEASELGLLLRDLKADSRHGVSYHRVDLSEPGSVTALKEGELVRFVTHSLSAPGYIRPYVVVRDSATLGALFPRKIGSVPSAEHAKQQRHLAKVFTHQIGPNPRITFLISPPERASGVPTILLPLNYSGLTTERSLLEKDRERHTGGRLVVFGKVDRMFPRASSPCENPIEQASSYLIEHVSHNCKLQAAEADGDSDGGQGSKPLKGTECFVSELKKQTEVAAPAAVIVPIAILK